MEMEAFGVVVGAIHLARRCYDAINGIKDAPEKLRALAAELQDLWVLLEQMKDGIFAEKEVMDTFGPILTNLEDTLEHLSDVLEKNVASNSHADGGGEKVSVASRSWGAIKAYLKDDDIKRFLDELQRRKLTINMSLLVISAKSKDTTLKELRRMKAESTMGGIHADQTDFDVILNLVSLRAAQGKLNKELSNSIQLSFNIIAEPAAFRSVKRTNTLQELEENSADGAEETVDERLLLTTRFTLSEFLRSLETPDYQSDLLRVKDAAAHTCSWLQEHTGYRQWLTEESSSILHLVGKLGSGKSVITKDLISRQRKEAVTKVSARSVVFHYFCSSVNRSDESCINILRALAHQFLQKEPALFYKLVTKSALFDSASPSTKWSYEALWEFFKILLSESKSKSMFFFIDALDECEVKYTENLLARISEWLEEDAKMLEGGKIVKFLFTSRPSDHILSSLHSNDNFHRIYVIPRYTKLDIESVIHKGLQQHYRRLNLKPDEVETLKALLAEKADGMFMWATLAIKEVGEAYDATYESLEKLINGLPAELEDMYESAWKKSVELLPKDKIEKARDILQWVALSRRPLKVSELSVALAIRKDMTNVPEKTKLMRNVAGFALRSLSAFVEVLPSNLKETTPTPPDESSGNKLERSDSSDLYDDPEATIQLVHLSAREYLLSARKTGKSSTSRLQFKVEEANFDITERILTFLLCNDLRKEKLNDPPDVFPLCPECKSEICTDTKKLTTTKGAIKTLIDAHPLFEYSLINWGFHLARLDNFSSMDATRYRKIQKLASTYLETKTAGPFHYYICVAILRHVFTNTSVGPDAKLAIDGSSPKRLHLAACYDVPALVSMMLKRRLNVDEKDALGQTPLIYACDHKVALDRLADNQKVIQLLLEQGADPMAKKYSGWNAVHLSGYYGNIHTLRLLMRKTSIDAEVPESSGSRVLHHAVHSGNFEIVRELIEEAKVDVNAKDNNGKTAIQCASACTNVEVVKLLLKNGANITQRNTMGYTPLHHVARSTGNLEIARALIDAGCDVDARDAIGYTPLHVAHTYPELAKLLIEKGANPNVRSSFWETPIYCCAFYPNDPERSSLRVLIERGADVNISSVHGISPLHTVLRRKLFPLVELLLDKGADVRAVTTRGVSVFHYAAANGTVDILKRIWSSLNDPSELQRKDFSCRDALYWAAGQANVRTLEFLLGLGIDTSSILNEDGSIPKFPLWTFTSGVVKYLRDKGLLKPKPGSHIEAAVKILCEEESMKLAASMPEHRVLDQFAISHDVRYGYSLLHWCVASRRIELVEAVLRAGESSTTLQDNVGCSPLALSLYMFDVQDKVSEKIFDALLNATPTTERGEGSKCITLAIALGLPTMTRTLLKKGFRPELESGGWDTYNIAEAYSCVDTADVLKDMKISRESDFKAYGKPLGISRLTNKLKIMLPKGSDKSHFTRLNTEWKIFLPHMRFKDSIKYDRDEDLYTALQYSTSFTRIGIQQCLGRAVIMKECLPPHLKEYYFEIEVINKPPARNTLRLGVVEKTYLDGLVHLAPFKTPHLRKTALYCSFCPRKAFFEDSHSFTYADRCSHIVNGMDRSKEIREGEVLGFGLSLDSGSFWVVRDGVKYKICYCLTKLQGRLYPFFSFEGTSVKLLRQLDHIPDMPSGDVTHK